MIEMSGVTKLYYKEEKKKNKFVKENIFKVYMQIQFFFLEIDFKIIATLK